MQIAAKMPGHVYSVASAAIGKPASIVYDTCTAFVGVYYVTVGLVGYFQREIGIPLRFVMIVAGIAAFLPDATIGFILPGFISGLGLIVGGGVLAAEYMTHRRVALARGPAE